MLAGVLISKQMYTCLEIEISSWRKGIRKVPVRRKMQFCHRGHKSGLEADRRCSTRREERP